VIVKIRLTRSEIKSLDEILDDVVPGISSRVNAIKFLRKTVMDRGQPTPGLAEAKHAVEEYMNRRGMRNTDGSEVKFGDSGRIVPLQPIKRMVCDFGEGEVEIDMEGLSLRAMMGLNSSVRIDDALALIELYGRIKRWEDEMTGTAKKEG